MVVGRGYISLCLAQLQAEAEKNLAELREEDESVRGHYDGYLTALEDVREKVLSEAPACSA
jgi:hypothetical protein